MSMVSIEYDRLGKDLNDSLMLFYKAAFIVVLLWLINILFISSHEIGHSIMGAFFGANILSINISPLGLDGSITQAGLNGTGEVFLVLCGGMAMTTALAATAYLINIDLAVYVLALRTIADAVMYTNGSDVLALHQSFGSYAYLVTVAAVALNAALILMAIRQARRNKDHSIVARYSHHIENLLSLR